MRPLRIAFVASELAPLAKTGGLADVSAALPRYLHRQGHDLRVFLPFYSTLRTGASEPLPVEFLQDLTLEMGGHPFRWSVWTLPLPGTSVWVHLIRCPELFDRPRLYSGDEDDAFRFAFLSRATLECCQRMGFAPNILHANDWHTALAPLFLRSIYGWDGIFAETKSVLTLHNVAYQGIFGRHLLPLLDLEAHASLLHQGHLAQGYFNFLETGILHADVLTTVSPTHAGEIQTDAFGMGLQDLLAQRSDRLVGILNGVDYDVWSPDTDELIPARYSAGDLAGKDACRKELLEAMGLPSAPLVGAPGERPPLLGIVSRLVGQKGFDLLMEPLPFFLRDHGVRLAVLGEGERRFEAYFTDLARRFSGRVAYYRGYEERLAHWIEAGADIFLMPSRYEPSGLNQMYSLRYGTPPLVRRTGGLADAVSHFDPETGEGNGFVFDHATSFGFSWALDRALDAWKEPAAWRRLQANGMAADFSWERQTERYEAVYGMLVGT